MRTAETLNLLTYLLTFNQC